jgi:hypothetical protein
VSFPAGDSEDGPRPDRVSLAAWRVRRPGCGVKSTRSKSPWEPTSVNSQPHKSVNSVTPASKSLLATRLVDAQAGGRSNGFWLGDGQLAHGTVWKEPVVLFRNRDDASSSFVG